MLQWDIMQRLFRALNWLWARHCKVHRLERTERMRPRDLWWTSSNTTGRRLCSDRRAENVRMRSFLRWTLFAAIRMKRDLLISVGKSCPPTTSQQPHGHLYLGIDLGQTPGIPSLLSPQSTHDRPWTCCRFSRK